MTIPVVNITGNVSLDGSHANQRLNVTAASVITIPNTTTYDFTNSDEMKIVRNTTGAVTFAVAAGVTLLSKGGLVAINVQNGVSTLIKISTNVWVLSGDI